MTFEDKPVHRMEDSSNSDKMIYSKNQRQIHFDALCKGHANGKSFDLYINRLPKQRVTITRITPLHDDSFVQLMSGTL